MEFRTELKLTPGLPIDHAFRIFTTGSCFADNLGQLLALNKFSASVNPFGATYNPVSIHEALIAALQQRGPSLDSFLSRDGSWFHYDFHSRWFAVSKEELAARLESGLKSCGDYLRNANVLLITYGTGWVYTLKETGRIAANCHKMPSHVFTRDLLSTEQVTASFRKLFNVLTSINPTIRVILTVSPVRHTRDTLELNQVSKSTLRVACHQLAHSFPSVEYFPAYEIMMDDLRDYRFYGADMLHPSDGAQEYIWHKFSDRYFTHSTQELIRAWTLVRKALDHKPFRPGRPEHQAFVKETLLKLRELKMHLDVDEEIRMLENQIVQ